MRVRGRGAVMPTMGWCNTNQPRLIALAEAFLPWRARLRRGEPRFAGDHRSGESPYTPAT